MDRRKFLGLGALGMLAGASAWLGRGEEAFAQAMGTGSVDPYTGRLFLFINAGGGWDPTMVCDPKGGTINRGFTEAQFGMAGGLTYAPVTYMNQGGYTNQQFFNKFHSRLLVFNGLDQETNNHDSGTRFTWSGRLEDGYPPLAAILAGALAPGRPLGFLSNGGYENTQGVVPLTRVDNLYTIASLAYPNRPDPNNMNSRVHSDMTAARIAAAQQARLAALSSRQTLPVMAAAMNQLLATRTGGNLLQRVMQYLPTNDQYNNAGNAILRQGMVALAGYQAGLTAAVNLSVGGFDTHGDHDNQQSNALGNLLKGVDLLMDRIDMLGLTDRVVVLIGSDFGRTPSYNAQNGKDHWSVTSLMMMGPGVRGDRVIGATDATQRARGFDYGTGSISDSATTRLSPKALHLALRRFAGVDTSELARQFPISFSGTLNVF